MSEVIVRMEMPLSCAVCRCHADGWCYLLSIQPSECTYDSRPSWCPIIGELPEQHGELIDMRELLKRKMKMDWSVLEWVHEVDICNARVIVPATERSE